MRWCCCWCCCWCCWCEIDGSSGACEAAADEPDGSVAAALKITPFLYGGAAWAAAAVAVVVAATAATGPAAAPAAVAVVVAADVAATAGTVAVVAVGAVAALPAGVAVAEGAWAADARQNVCREPGRIPSAASCAAACGG